MKEEKKEGKEKGRHGWRGKIGKIAFSSLSLHKTCTGPQLSVAQVATFSRPNHTHPRSQRQNQHNKTRESIFQKYINSNYIMKNQDITHVFKTQYQSTEHSKQHRVLNYLEYSKPRYLNPRTLYLEQTTNGVCRKQYTYNKPQNHNKSNNNVSCCPTLSNQHWPQATIEVYCTAVNKLPYEEPNSPEVQSLCRTLKMLTFLEKAVISQDVTRNGTRAITCISQTPQGPSSRHLSLNVRSN